ncbi:MAG: hypothetical protein IJV71_04420 [Lachnospiraceae bacterium]|nr:hypothetical protein [Lachnospiraceae bacterium]
MIKGNLRKLIATALIAVSVMSSSIMTYAAYTEENSVLSPAATTAVESARTAAKRISGTAATATGAAATAYFAPSSFGTLSSGFVSSGTSSDTVSRSMLVYLKELDGEGNDDELIRIYQGSFYGRKLMSITKYSDRNVGEIEATGDAAAELYITMKVGRLPGDLVTSVQEGFFKCYFAMN